jgi:hypothetical protein
MNEKPAADDAINVTLVNDSEDSKDLGEWKVDGKHFHPILGSRIDTNAAIAAKREGKPGPYSPEVTIPMAVYKHIHKESRAVRYWIEKREIYLKAA